MEKRVPLVKVEIEDVELDDELLRSLETGELVTLLRFVVVGGPANGGVVGIEIRVWAFRV